MKTPCLCPGGPCPERAAPDSRPRRATAWPTLATVLAALLAALYLVGVADATPSDGRAALAQFR